MIDWVDIYITLKHLIVELSRVADKIQNLYMDVSFSFAQDGVIMEYSQKIISLTDMYMTTTCLCGGITIEFVMENDILYNC